MLELELEKQTAEKVSLRNISLEELLGLSELTDQNKPITIPDYQRIYCWPEKQVLQLLDDLVNYSSKTFHLGNIILHKSKDGYHIVDGQQRLVTLSLLLHQLDKTLNIRLLDERFESDEATKYVGYNKWLISSFCAKNQSLNVNDLIQNIQFSVLIIESVMLDLAYTFFSNQNSRGKALTDFDLLKAHHLRFIPYQEQAEHLASRWDDIIIRSGSSESDQLLGKLFGTYLFRLRKWLRKNQWNNNTKYRIKAEFEAALVIPEIPPFGEQFKFSESIQGGSHFFAYTDQFIYKFQKFIETPQYKSLNGHLIHETHWWYREIIEAFLFAYYLKFGDIYMGEAMAGISVVVSNHRFNTQRAQLGSILHFAGNSEIIMMIEQATSPTFFLAELSAVIKTMSVPEDLKGTRSRYKHALRKAIVESTKEPIIVNYPL